MNIYPLCHSVAILYPSLLRATSCFQIVYRKVRNLQVLKNLVEKVLINLLHRIKPATYLHTSALLMCPMLMLIYSLTQQTLGLNYVHVLEVHADPMGRWLQHFQDIMNRSVSYSLISCTNVCCEIIMQQQQSPFKCSETIPVVDNPHRNSSATIVIKHKGCKV